MADKSENPNDEAIPQHKKLAMGKGLTPAPTGKPSDEGGGTPKGDATKK